MQIMLRGSGNPRTAPPRKRRLPEEWPEEMYGVAEPKGGATGGTAAGRSRPTAKAMAKPMVPMPTIME
eukprot:5642583-Prorocentrum_lima.AAC.1